MYNKFGNMGRKYQGSKTIIIIQDGSFIGRILHFPRKAKPPFFING
jgi:hypothetical protein